MPDPATIRIGTRGSELATTQAGHVRDALIELGQPAELVIVKTAGDHNRHDPVEKIGIGVFTQALRHALREGVCDIIVHSFKDLPTLPEDDMMVAAVPERVDPREALISRDATPLMDLPEGARVGTSAPRRVSQLRALRSDLELVPLRGNIETRMGRVSEDLDAVILARAGLERTGRLGEIAESWTWMSSCRPRPRAPWLWSAALLTAKLWIFCARLTTRCPMPALSRSARCSISWKRAAPLRSRPTQL